jgi:chromatin assembly factor 1 subunit B
MHVYSITHKHGNLEVHAVGKNTKLPYHHARTPSQTRTPSRARPNMSRRLSTASEAESIATSHSEHIRDELPSLTGFGFPSSSSLPQMATPSASVASTPVTTATMFPPSMEMAASSRRSSISAPGSPAPTGRYGRSPSPMPALPAIRSMPANAWSSVRLYGDESFTNFFRRLTFSPDGGLLLTPAGQFEDPSVSVTTTKGGKGDESSSGRGGKLSLSIGDDTPTNPSSISSVFIYSRANFARPPIAQLPGHKKASIAVRFAPVLFELRQGVAGPVPEPPKSITLEKGKEESVIVNMLGPEPSASQQLVASIPAHLRTPSQSQLHSPTAIAATSSTPAMLSPALSAVDGYRPVTPSLKGRLAAATGTSSVFALPYRMLFAVATMDTVAIHDTQQAGPICLLTKLHYDEFTDMTWCVPYSFILGLCSFYRKVS